jgi:hypothetical protein
VNKLKNPCLAATLNTLINGNCKSILMQAINQAFGASGNYTIQFEELPASQMPGTDFLGYMNSSKTSFAGSAQNPYMSGTVVIELNVDSLSGASKELQAAVILHEALHGIFTARGLSALQQHDLMSEIYTAQIKAGLLEYYPTLSDGDASALSWVGLQWTYEWSMFAARSFGATEVLRTIQKYLKGLSGTKC